MSLMPIWRHWRRGPFFPLIGHTTSLWPPLSFTRFDHEGGVIQISADLVKFQFFSGNFRKFWKVQRVFWKVYWVIRIPKWCFWWCTHHVFVSGIGINIIWENSKKNRSGYIPRYTFLAGRYSQQDFPEFYKCFSGKSGYLLSFLENVWVNCVLKIML